MSVLFSSSKRAPRGQTIIVSCKSHPDRDYRRDYLCTACTWISLALAKGLTIVGANSSISMEDANE